MTESSSQAEENIHEFEFQSHLSLKEILKKLEGEAFESINWATRESEYDGVYIVGRKKIAENHEIKLRILDYTKDIKADLHDYSLEIYFPLGSQLQSIVSLNEKENFLKIMVPKILASVA